MSEQYTFPVFIHLITIPLTLGAGFFLGWVLRGAAEKQSRRRGPLPRGPGVPGGPGGSPGGR